MSKVLNVVRIQDGIGIAGQEEIQGVIYGMTVHQNQDNDRNKG